jgi:hypothetical protein
MESFNIKTDLIDNKGNINSIIGNIKFFNRGKYGFNTKALGLYLTVVLIIASCVLMFYLVYIIDIYLIYNRYNYVHSAYARIPMIFIVVISTIAVLIQTLYVSVSNPGFFKPNEGADMSKEINSSREY